MVSEAEVWRILSEFNSIKPVEFLQQIDVNSMGIGKVLGFISCANREVSAGEISEYMEVSTARVAVLLKKMSDKGLIVKHSDPNDARRVLVSITDEGRTLLKEKREEILLYAGAIIDRFGKEKIEDFIQACREIKSIVEDVERAQNSGDPNSHSISSDK